MSKKYITDVIKIDGQLLDGNGSAGTSGQVLSSTGTATDWVSLSEISGVDGSGTANTVAMWSDSDTITDAPITISGNDATFSGSVTAANLFLGSSSVRVSPGGSGELGLNYNTGATGSLVWYAGTTSSKFSVTNAGNATFAGTIAVQGTGDSYFTGNVGIGETNPLEKLHVNGGNVLIQGGPSTTSQSELGFTNAFDTAFIRSRYTNPSATTETYLAFHTNTAGDNNGTVAEQMRIAGNKVGIGTTNPSYKLDVKGGGGFNDILNLSGAQPRFLLIETDTTDTNYEILVSGGTLFFRTTNDAITSFSNKLSLTQAGVLTLNGYGAGILTTNASGQVSVDTTTYIPTTDYNDFVNVAGDTMTGVLTILNSSDPKLILQTSPGDSSDWNYINFVGRDTVRDGYIGTEFSGDMRVYSDKNTSSVELTANGIILNGGDVGIGATSPENKLHVQQPSAYTGIHTTAGIRVKSDAASSIGSYHGTIALSRGTGSVAISAVQEATDSDVMGMAFFTHPSATGGDASVEQMRIDADGNVGIGTTSIDEKLHLYNNGDVGIRLQNQADTSGNTWRLWQDNWNGASSFTFNIDYGSTNIITALTNGRVGIGTDNPGARLQIAGSDSFNALKITDSGNGDGFKVSSVTTQGTYIQAYDASHVQTIKLDARTDNGTRHTYFNGGGYVGIGTTDPQEKLHVNGNLGLGTSPTIKWTSNTLRFEPFGDYIPVVVLGGTTSYAPRFEIKNAGDAATVVMLDGSGNSYINTGNVGIGTASPGEKLTVNGAIVWQGALVSSQTNSGVLDRSGNDLRIRAYGATAGTGNLVFRTGGGGGSVDSEAMRIDSSGDVGINETNPSQKLHVSGNLRVTGFYYDSTNSAGTTGQVLRVTSGGTGWDTLTASDVGAATTSHTHAAADITSGTFADARIALTNITQHTDPKYLRSDASDTASELITFQKGISQDGNAKFYTWRALNNTSDTSNQYYRIARITSTQSSRFAIELAGRSTSYADPNIPAIGFIVGQLNNDNDYDIVFYNHSTGTSEVVLEVGQVDVSTTDTDIYIRTIQYAEISATGHISDGSITTYGGDNASTTEPANYVAATEVTVWNSGNDGSGSGLDADLLDGNHASAFALSSHTHDDRYYTETEIGNFFSGTTAITGYSKTNWDAAYTYSQVGHLPLTAGSSYPLTGALHFGDDYNYIEKNASSDMLMVANRHITFSDVISGVVNERMRIEEGGNVGINETNPSQKLHVNGNARVTGFYYDSTNSAGTPGYVLSSTSGGTEWVTADSVISYKWYAVSDGGLASASISNSTSLDFQGGTGISTSTSGSGSAYTIEFTNTDRGSAQNIFKNVAGPTGQPTIVAASNNDTVTLKDDRFITITTNNSTKTAQFSPKALEVCDFVLAFKSPSAQTNYLVWVNGSYQSTTGLETYKTALYAGEIDVVKIISDVTVSGVYIDVYETGAPTTPIWSSGSTNLTANTLMSFSPSGATFSSSDQLYATIAIPTSATVVYRLDFGLLYS